MYTEYQAFKVLEPTSPDIEGPFYKSGAPERMQLVGQPTLAIRGRVLATDGHGIVGATLDFWQADEKGVYDNVGYTLRGKQVTGVYPRGAYELLTVHPGDYQIGEHEFRCSHIHVKVTVSGYKPLTTQLYFSDDPYNSTDHWFNASRVIGSVKDSEVSFDFVLERTE